MEWTTYRREWSPLGPWLALLILAAGRLALAADSDEFRVKREVVFEFADKPRVTRDGDRVTIRFASQGFCDATVAIEDPESRIVRHLASGVLGPNAPAPFQRNSKVQTLVWDGKDDQGRYLDQIAGCTVRVSLGLNPRFEKNLYWSPYKKFTEAVPLVQSAAEGMYVFEGRGIDSLKLYDHEGRYLRTIYPFAANKLHDVEGLNWITFPQDNASLPLKNSLYLQTLLSSGDNASCSNRLGMTGAAAAAMAVRDGRIALTKLCLNRLSSDGTTGGRPLVGPKTSVLLKKVRWQYKNEDIEIAPTSAAISPDAKWLYLTGYGWRFPLNFDLNNCVMRLPLDGDGELELFKGSINPEEFGNGPDQLTAPTSVDCDRQGRVYIADYMNDRIQVFSPDGQLLKSISIFKPTVIRLHRQTDEIYVFSWLFCNRHLSQRGKNKTQVETVIPATLTHLGTLDDPQQKARYDLPIPEFKGHYSTYTGIEHAALYSGEIDSWSDKLTVWLGRDCVQNIDRGVHPGDGGRRMAWEQAGLQILRVGAEGKLETIREFGRDVANDDTVVRARPPSNAIQRLIVNPKTGLLYVGEADSGATVKAFKQLVEIDPGTGKAKLIDTPFNAIEGAFDVDGMIYLRTTNTIVRYVLEGWREVPFDYGEQLPQVGAGMFGRYSKSQSGLVMPAQSPVCFHQGDFYVSPKGNIVVSCAYRYTGDERKDEHPIRLDVGGGGDQLYGKPYTPKVFPGRVFSSTGACVHIWNKHGQMIHEDAVPGCPQMDGIALDRDDNIYMMATPTRVLDGQKHFNEMSETIVKVKPKSGQVLAASQRAPVPLSKDAQPKQAPDLHNSTLSDAWFQGAEWFYGGVGFAGFNSSNAGGGCACWFSRFTLDYFARSIAPEVEHYSVAILDANGNLITRVGRYGNVDSAGPDSLVPLGGDEVGLMHACYVGTHTDRRLFISDVGNGRIVSVKLGYHANASVPLPAITQPGK